MKHGALLFIFIFTTFSAQDISRKLDAARIELMKSAPATSANLSFYVAKENGDLVYEYNGNSGLSTASTQKIFSAAAALETLGTDYQYKTRASFSGNLSHGTLSGNLFLWSDGDPTLGSWRYPGYLPEDFKKKLLAAISDQNIRKINGDLILDDSYFDMQSIPGGWPWNDLGNYYGAGVWGINWRENQFDLRVRGNKIENTNVTLPGVDWVSELKTGGNSDQSLIFTAPFSDVALINGMLPAGKLSTVSGAMPNPPLTLGTEIKSWLEEEGISLEGKIRTTSEMRIAGVNPPVFPSENTFFEYKSPTLDKIVYWFMRKSVNLYGETFVKTLAKEKRGEGGFASGISFLKAFWKAKGISPYMINFADGSGLSPQNYVSGKAQVQALLYAKKQPWFSAFAEGFPVQGNGMKMKSGTMKNTKSFAGYHGGYVFSIIINNYQGSDISNALYKVLNVLK